jgi:hypothetical protein
MNKHGYAIVSKAMLSAGYHGLSQDHEYSDVTEVVSGMARGVDTLGIDWAVENWLPWKEFYADWKHYGKSAGYKRNEEMAIYADALVAIWDGKSKGTKHMIDLANKHGLIVYVHRI